MASKFILTAQLKLQAPSQQQLASIRTAINKQFTGFKIPLKINLGKNVVNNAVSALKTLDAKLDVTTNKFLLFIQMVKNAMTQITTVSFIAQVLGKLVKQINTASNAITAMTNKVSKLNSTTSSTQFQIAGFQAALKNIASMGLKTQTTVNGISGSIKEMGLHAAQSIKRFGTFTLITSSFLSLFHAIRNSITEAIAFQAEVIKLRQVTDQSATGVSELVDEVNRLSIGLGVSSKELLDVTVTLAQAGLTAKNTRLSLEAIAKASLSPSFDDMNSIVEGSIAIFQQFGKSSKDLEEILGSMSEVAAKFAVESADLNTAIRRTGGAFQAAGGDINQLFALFTSVRQTTRESAESIATGFRTIFARLQRNRTQDFLKQFGINLRFTKEEAEKFGKSANTFVGPYEAIRRLAQALNEVDSADPRFAQIVEELGGFRQISKVIPLIKQNTIAQQAYQVALEGTNSLEEDAKVAQESLLNKLIKVREEFQLLVRSVADNDAFKQMIDSILGLARAFIKLADSVQPILPALIGLGTFQVTRNLGEYLSGAAQGFKLPNSDSKNNPQSLRSRVSGALGSGPHLLALSIGANTAARSLVKFGGATDQAIIGLTNIVSQFAIFREIITSIGPFSGPQNRLTNSRNKLSGLQTEIDKVRALHPFLNDPQLIAANRAQHQNLRKQFKQEEALIPGLEKEANTMLAVASSIAAVVAISSVLSDTFNTLADAELRVLRASGGSGDRSGFIRNSRLGSATSTGGQAAGVGIAIGAGIGSVVPGVGTAIGATVGGLIGALSGGAFGWIEAGEKAQAILNQIDFNERFTKTSGALDAVAKNTRNPQSALSDIRIGLSDLQNQLRTIRDPDSRIDILAAGKNSTTQLNAFFHDLATTTSSLDEFKRVVGDDLLNTFSYLSKNSLPEFLEQINNTIETQKEKKRIDENAIKLQIEYNEAIKSQLLFASALDEAQIAVSDFAAALQSSLSFASGGVGGPSTFKFNAIDQLNDGGLISDITRFEKNINILTASFGNFGKEQGTKAVTAAKISKELPALLLDLVGSGALDDTGNISDRLENRLEEKFGNDIPRAFIDALVQKSDELRGAEKKDTKLFEAFKSDPQAAIGEFLKVLENQAAGLAKPAQKIQDAFNQYSQTMFELVNINKTLVQEYNATRDLLGQRSRFITGANGDKTDFNLLRGLDLGKQSDILGNGNRQLLNDPTGIANAARATQDEIRTREKNLQSKVLTDNERINEIHALTDAKNKLSEFNDALKFMSDAASRAAVDVEELSELTSRRNARKGLFTQFLGADNAGRRDIRRNIAAADLASQQGNLNGIRQDQRADVLSLLENINPDKFKEILANEAKALGIDPKGILTPDDKEAELIKTVTATYDRAIEAQRAYAQLLQDNASKYLTDQFNLFKDFLAEFRDIVRANFSKDLNDQFNGKAGQFNLAIGDREKFTNLQKITGTGNLGAIQRFLDIQKQVESIDNTDKLAKFSAALPSDGIPGVRVQDARTKDVENFINNNITGASLGVSEEQARKLKANIFNRFGEISNGTFASAGGASNIIREEIGTLIKDLNKQKLLQTNELNNVTNDLGGQGVANNINNNRKVVEDLLQQLPKDFNINENTKQLETLNAQMAELNRRLNNGPGFARGGFIPGAGSQDNTLVKTTPGEFIMRKSVAQRYGNFLSIMNKTGRIPAFASGGFVGSGGSSGGISALNSAITTFGVNVNKMVQALALFPREIHMNATHTVNVVHTGAQVFSSLEPALVNLVERKVSQAINNLSSKYLEIGRVADADLFNNNGSAIGGVNFQG